VLEPLVGEGCQRNGRGAVRPWGPRHAPTGLDQAGRRCSGR
jgi:hypothetical protein